MFKLNLSKKIFIFLALSTFCLSSIFSQSQSAKPDALKLYNEGKYKEAILVCEDEIASNSNNREAYVVLCWALIANKQYSEAEQRATEARSLNAYDARLIEVLGEAKYFLGKNNEALNLFQRYIASVPENANRVGRVYYYMGEIYIRQTRYEHADISFSAAVRSEPTRDYWWTRLGYAREMTSDWRNAILAYDRALSINASQYDATRGKLRCQSHIN